MQNDAERAVILVCSVRVNVRDLRKADEQDQSKAKQSAGHEEPRGRSIAAFISSWNRGEQISPSVKNTRDLDEIRERRLLLRLNFLRGGKNPFPRIERLNCLEMCKFGPIRPKISASLFVAVLCAGGILHAQTGMAQQNQAPLPMPQPVPGTGSNHRLILKDGTFQDVRVYEISGDRVRYISLDRGGDWEELPVSLVDWAATRKWEQDHGNLTDDSSPAMKEAAELDREEATARADEQYRMPAVAPGLELPDADGIFVLDTFQGVPELVEMKPLALPQDWKGHHGANGLNPLAGARTHIELDGEHARIHLHVNDPVFYASLDTEDKGDVVVTHAFTVHTDSSQVQNGKFGAHSASSNFVILRLDERQAVRFIGPLNLNADGTVQPADWIIPVRVEAMPGKHWLKISLQKKLLFGEYALIEIQGPGQIGASIWDFRVYPVLGDNPGALTAIKEQ